MKVLEIVLPILIGALIGYCTNYIAVKMLFFPRKERRIGKWKVPFTPGIIPKNKSRLATAVGNAVGDKLLTEEDLTAAFQSSGIKESFISKITDSLTQDDASLKERAVCLTSEDRVADVTDKLSDVLTVKILDVLKSIDMHKAIFEVANASFAGLLSNPMVAMFLGRNALDSICAKVETGISGYIDEKGREGLQPIVKGEIEKILARSTKENLAALDCNRDTLRDLLSKVFDGFILGNIAAIARHIDVKGIVERKINEMDVKELEDLVMSVMKNELRAIVNLGAFIGAIIGIINIFI